MDTGYHMFQIWAQSDSPSPYSSSEQNIAFYLAKPGMASGAGADNVAPAGPDKEPPTTATGASQETETNGEAKLAPANTAPLFALPKLIAGGVQTSYATVKLQIGSSAPVGGDNIGPVALSGPTDVKVVVPHGSTARRFAYALYRDGAIVYQSDQFLPASGTLIRLQERNGSQPGLLPGDILLKAWGVDQSGSYGPATSITVTIPTNGAEETVK
jgi:hypothetical protein